MNKEEIIEKFKEARDLIDLSEKNIGNEEAVVIAECLTTVTRSFPWCGIMLELWLRHNQIGDKGAIALAKALKTNTMLLDTLDLSYNHIGDEGAIALAKAIKCDPNIHLVRLSGNNIGTEGVKALERALDHNKNFIAISMDGNPNAEKYLKLKANRWLLDYTRRGR